MLFGEILRAEAAHGGYERGRITRQVQGEPVGAALEGARHRVPGRHGHQRNGARCEQQQRQSGNIVHAAKAGRTR